MNWKVRPATSDDEPVVRCLYEEGERVFDNAPAIFRRRVLDEILRELGEGSVLVAEEESGAVKGFNRIRVCDGFLLGLNVVVSKDARGNGCGQALIDAGHELGRSQGARSAVFTMWPGANLSSFYEKCGYREVGRVMLAEL
jgi:GNAT superfamily N-acetyltransferase